MEFGVKLRQNVLGSRTVIYDEYCVKINYVWIMYVSIYVPSQNLIIHIIPVPFPYPSLPVIVDMYAIKSFAKS